MATLPPDGSKEALARALDEVPTDKEFAAANPPVFNIQREFDKMVGSAPEIVKDSPQYSAMRTAFHGGAMTMFHFFLNELGDTDEKTAHAIFSDIRLQMAQFGYDESIRVGASAELIALAKKALDTTKRESEEA